MCEYCENKVPSFIEIDSTETMEVAINNKGILDVNVFDINDYLIDEMVLKLKYCPMCGRKFEK